MSLSLLRGHAREVIAHAIGGRMCREKDEAVARLETIAPARQERP
jgi:hypothetical protein